MSLFDLDFQIISFQYVESSRELSRAASLCEDDPIKQEMIAFIKPHFAKNVARSEGLKLLVEKDYDMAEQIIEKIGGIKTDELLN